MGEPGHPGPGRGSSCRSASPALAAVAVDGADLGDRPAHLERVADDRQEPVVGERELEDVVGAGVDASRDLVEGVAVSGVVRTMTGICSLAGSARIRRQVSLTSPAAAPTPIRTASGWRTTTAEIAALPWPTARTS